MSDTEETRAARRQNQPVATKNKDKQYKDPEASSSSGSSHGSADEFFNQ